MGELLGTQWQVDYILRDSADENSFLPVVRLLGDGRFKKVGGLNRDRTFVTQTYIPDDPIPSHPDDWVVRGLTNIGWNFEVNLHEDGSLSISITTSKKYALLWDGGKAVVDWNYMAGEIDDSHPFRAVDDLESIIKNIKRRVEDFIRAALAYNKRAEETLISGAQYSMEYVLSQYDLRRIPDLLKQAQEIVTDEELAQLSVVNPLGAGHIQELHTQVVDAIQAGLKYPGTTLQSNCIRNAWRESTYLRRAVEGFRW